MRDADTGATPPAAGAARDATVLLRCDICGSERIHVYPGELAQRRALCLACGAHYFEATGWLDPEELGSSPRPG